MHAMVLAAGLGTRLRPLTDELPKPAVPVLNRPLVATTLAHLARAGAQSITLNTHHLPEQLRAALEPHAPPGVALRFVHEPEILGTGGGIRNAWRAAGAPDQFVVMNGDVLFEPDLAAALTLHRDAKAVATMVLRSVADADRYGAIEIDHAGRVRRLLGLPPDADGLRKFMFTGVHVLSRRALESLPERGCVVRQGYRRWLDEGDVVAGYVDASQWLELGTPTDYATAQLDLLVQGASQRGLPSGADCSLIDPSAAIDPRATIRTSVIGAGCRVSGAVTLERVILWPGARVDRDLHDTIVTSGDTVVTWHP